MLYCLVLIPDLDPIKKPSHHLYRKNWKDEDPGGGENDRVDNVHGADPSRNKIKNKNKPTRWCRAIYYSHSFVGVVSSKS